MAHRHGENTSERWRPRPTLRGGKVQQQAAQDSQWTAVSDDGDAIRPCVERCRGVACSRAAQCCAIPAFDAVPQCLLRFPTGRGAVPRIGRPRVAFATVDVAPRTAFPGPEVQFAQFRMENQAARIARCQGTRQFDTSTRRAGVDRGHRRQSLDETSDVLRCGGSQRHIAGPIADVRFQRSPGVAN